MILRTAILLCFALLLPSQGIGADSYAHGEALEERSHREVVRLHEVIEAWLAGSMPNDDDAYSGFSDAMADDFEIISPSGMRSDRDAIVSAFRNAYGSRQAGFSVVIKNIRTRLLAPPLALLTYEEWQYEKDTTTARLSTVVLRDAPGKPGGIAWVHLQETWLPVP